MVIFALVVLAVMGNGYQKQMKFDHCKSIEFETEYCSGMKKVYEFSEKMEEKK